MPMKRVQHRLDAHGGHRSCRVRRREVVRKEGQPDHVVQVGMTQEGVLDLTLLFYRQCGGAGAGIHEHTVVHQKGRGALPLAFSAERAEHFDLHRHGSFLYARA